MSAIIFDSFKGIYHSYYQIGKDWTSPNHAMPQTHIMCNLKIKRYGEDAKIIMGFFGVEGWTYWSGEAIENFGDIIEWKYIPTMQKTCEII